MKQITYDLRAGQPDSNDFYKRLDTFSSEVFNTIEARVGYIISEMMAFVERRSVEKLRSRAEYAVEVLTLGMTWRHYLGASQQTPGWVVAMLKKLFDLRRTNRTLKPFADRLRGVISSRLVVPRIGLAPADAAVTLANFARLIRWLEATGEFKDEVKRLRIWYAFLESLQPDGIALMLPMVLNLFDWFASAARQELGGYTTGVESFLKEVHPAYKNREDVVFCGKQEVEYHLNMVGSEIMNRGFRDSYLATTRKTLLVPGCMRPDEAAACQADVDGFNIRCTRCNAECRVGQLNSLGQQHGFDVFIVPHSSSFTQWLKRWENSTETGLIAVACLLNLVPGGYEMRELNIPAQCLLLDYCGCRKHWHPKGIATDINQHRLIDLVKG